MEPLKIPYESEKIYLLLLQNALNPTLTEIIEQNDHYNKNYLIIIQSRKQFLVDSNWSKGNSRVVCKVTRLKFNGFFWWSHLNSKIYTTQSESLKDIRQQNYVRINL